MLYDIPRILDAIDSRKDNDKGKTLIRLLRKAIKLLAVYQRLEIQPGREMTFDELVTLISKKEATSFSKDLSQLEETLLSKVKAINRHPGRPGTGRYVWLNEDAAAKLAIRKLEQWIASTAYFCGIRLDQSVRVGVGVLLTSYHAWIAVRKLLRNPLREHKIEFELVDGLPQHLLKLFYEQTLDIIVTSFSAQQIGQLENCLTQDFACKLLTDRRNALSGSVGSECRWEILENKRLVLQTERIPALEFNRSLIPKSCRIIPASSWSQAFAMVLACDDTFCLGCPQLLPSRERTRFREINLTGLPKLTVGVAWQIHSGKNSTQIEALVRAFKDQLLKMADDSPHADQRFTRNWYTAHLTYGPDGTKQWIKGEIINVTVTPGGRLRGDHRIFHSLERSALEMTFEGTITYHSFDQVYNIAWRSWQRGDTGTRTYVASFSVKEHQLDESKPIFGIWSGQLPMDKRDKTHGLGLFIFSKYLLSIEELNKFSGFLKSEESRLSQERFDDLLIPPEIKEATPSTPVMSKGEGI